MSEADLQAVRDALRQFQDGYERRDPALLEDFRRLFVQDEALELIGTGAVMPGDEEWCLGPDAACALVANDWAGWGNVVLDLADANVHVLGSVAWVAATGTVSMELDPEESYRDWIETVRGEASENTRPPRETLLEILRAGTNTLFEAERGRQFTWPLRFTAVLIREAGVWLFHQVHFSFATTRYPDVRNL